MRSNQETVRDAFATWMSGTGSITGIFATDMRWEIVGRCAVAGVYRGAQDFVDRVLAPFGARFASDKPFRPVNVRALYADDSQGAVIVVWDGEGMTVQGTSYRNTYAWVLTFTDGKVSDATAFFDSIAFDELWAVRPA